MSTSYPPAPLEGEAPELEGVTLRDYLAVMWRRKWLILLVTVVAAGAAYFFTDRQPDKYEATATLIYEAQIDVSNVPAAFLGIIMRADGAGGRYGYSCGSYYGHYEHDSDGGRGGRSGKHRGEDARRTERSGRDV